MSTWSAEELGGAPPSRPPHPPPPRAKRKGLTWTEIFIVSAICIVLAAIAIPSFLEAQLRSNVSKTFSPQRVVATAIESYYVDHGCYPSVVPLASHPTVDLERLKKDGGGNLTGVSEGVFFYADRSVWRDPFSPRGEDRPFVYFTDGDGWMLLSMGPDGDYDFDPAQLYDSAIPQPSVRLLISGTYDPTNGSTSSGDVWRVKE